MTEAGPAGTSGHVTLREAEPGDIEACAQVCFDAFGGFHDHHRFPRDFPVLEAAAGIMGMWVPHPSIWGVVAEIDGRVVGSNFLDERDPIRGVGPITVDPEGQDAGVGRKLMHAVVERGEGAAGIRLLQDAFNMRSLSLYESLGFDVKEPVAVMTGKPRSGPVEGVEVRPLVEADLDECASLCKQVHGFERTNELRDAIQAFAPFVAVRQWTPRGLRLGGLVLADEPRCRRERGRLKALRCAGLHKYRQGDSNPGFRRERAAS